MSSNVIYSNLYDDRNETSIEYAWKNFLYINSVCVSRDILLDNKFPEQYSSWEDMHLWLRILLKYPFYQVPVYTTVAVTHNANSHKAISCDLKRLKKHHECLDNLFIYYGKDLSRYISREMVKEYLSSFYKMVVVNSWKRKKYILTAKAFFHLAAMNRFNFSFLFDSLQKFLKISYN